MQRVGISDRVEGVIIDCFDRGGGETKLLGEGSMKRKDCWEMGESKN